MSTHQTPPPVIMHGALQELVDALHQQAEGQFPPAAVTKLLQELALPPAALERYTFFAPRCYTRNCIYKTPQFELLLLCWQPGQASAVHGHEGQLCWMRVVAGALTFINYTDHSNGQLLETSRAAGGAGFVDGPAYIHAVQNQTNQPALSLHLYARPFQECTVYEVDQNLSRRQALTYHSIYGKRC